MSGKYQVSGRNQMLDRDQMSSGDQVSGSRMSDLAGLCRQLERNDAL